MPTAYRPRRSVLYIPGSNPRALAKAESLACDGVILDLEDAVAPDVKEAARAAVIAASGRYGAREVLIRANGFDTPWGGDDVSAVAGSAAHGVVLPKVENAETVRQAEALLVAAGAPDSLALWCMIETPRGVLAAAEIAAASPRLGGLIMGTSDLAKDLHCRHTPDRLPLITSLSLCVLAARAHTLAILDGVHLNLDDDAGFQAACQQGRDMGFDGKTLIHPKTIAAANAAFGPSDADIAYAEKIVAAYTAALQAQQAVVVVDGKLVEALHVAEAQRLLGEVQVQRVLNRD